VLIALIDTDDLRRRSQEFGSLQILAFLLIAVQPLRDSLLLAATRRGEIIYTPRREYRERGENLLIAILRKVKSENTSSERKAIISLSTEITRPMDKRALLPRSRYSFLSLAARSIEYLAYSWGLDVSPRRTFEKRLYVEPIPSNVESIARPGDKLNSRLTLFKSGSRIAELHFFAASSANVTQHRVTTAADEDGYALRQRKQRKGGFSSTVDPT